MHPIVYYFMAIVALSVACVSSASAGGPAPEKSINSGIDTIFSVQPDISPSLALDILAIARSTTDPAQPAIMGQATAPVTRPIGGVDPVMITDPVTASGGIDSVLKSLNEQIALMSAKLDGSALPPLPIRE